MDERAVSYSYLQCAAIDFLLLNPQLTLALAGKYLSIHLIEQIISHTMNP